MHILQRSKVSIKDEDLKCLKPRKWLTDDVTFIFITNSLLTNSPKSI